MQLIQMLLQLAEVFVVVGINHNIYDKRIIQDCLGSSIVGTWRFSEPYCKRLRKENGCDSLFEHLEEMARKFEEEGIQAPQQLVHSD